MDGRVFREYPDGTVILKTVSSTEERAELLVGMVKSPDDPQSLGGWLWLTRDPDTGAERIFDNEYCVSCHADANERRLQTERFPAGVANPDREFRDFVFHPYFTTPE